MPKSALHIKPHNVGKQLSFGESSEERTIENNGSIKNSKVLTKVRNAGNIPPVINEERERVIRSHENKARIENALRIGKLANKSYKLNILPESPPQEEQPEFIPYDMTTHIVKQSKGAKAPILAHESARNEYMNTVMGGRRKTRRSKNSRKPTRRSKNSRKH
jgi:hypothetical protein